MQQTKEEFITKAKLIHGDKYDYSNVIYINALIPIKITCPKHGEPNNHLNGQNCLKCSKILKNKFLTTEEFITKAKLIHGNKYDYSSSHYINNKTKCSIICSKHGEFFQIPNSHLNGNGCPKCKSSKGENKIMNILNLLQ